MTTTALAPAPANRSLGHVLGRVAVLEVAVRQAVARRRAADPEPGDPLRGVFLSDSYVQWLLDRGSSPDRTDDDDDGALLRRQLESDADAAEADGVDLRLRRLSRTFHLDPLDEELLVIALAPVLDPRFQQLFGYLNDDVTRPYPSVLLAVELATGQNPAPPREWMRLAPGSRLLAARLVEQGEDPVPLPSRSVRAADRVLTFLLGGDTPDPALAEAVQTVAPLPAVDPALARLQRPAVVVIRQRPGTDAAVEAATWIASTGRDPLVVRAPAGGADGVSRDLVALWVRESLLAGRPLVVGPADDLLRDDRAAVTVRQLAAAAPPVVLWTTRDTAVTAGELVVASVDMAVPGLAHRREAWTRSCRGLGVPDRDLLDLAEQHRVGAARVARAVEAARAAAAAEGVPVDRAALERGVRMQDDPALQALARRVRPSRTLADLVVPARTQQELGELVSMARRRDRLRESWGLSRGTGAGGVCALFVGPSGTGKTLAAEVIAGQLGIDLYVVDLARVVDKYIGETEKNLDRVLSAAEGATGLLFVDEADALFGRRADVRHGQDRYANLEVSYLLQRVEDFGGVVVLATNLRSHVDEAFVRRLDAVVEFEPPGPEARAGLWARHLARVDVADDVDLQFCATAFDLPGGSIRNVAAAAACIAADAGRPVGMVDLVRGLEREYRKLGRLRVPGDFGRYADLLGGPS